MTANEALRIKYSDPVDPWEEIDTTEWGRVPAWKAAALAGGAMNVYAQVRNDAVEAETKIASLEQRERDIVEREQRCDARERQLTDIAARLRDQISRADAQWDKIEQARADQEEEEPLPAPPSDPAEPPPGADQEQPAHGDPPGALAKAPELEDDAALPGDPSLPRPLRGDDTPAPSGELHSIRAKENPQPAAELDARGEFLRIKHDEVEFPEGEMPEPPEQQQPIAAGLDVGD